MTCAHQPQVQLRQFTPQPYAGAIAAARTCYAADIIAPPQVTDKQCQTIGPLTFNAGHHTVYQHAHFEFSLSHVSRHFVWSVLHSFPYYNSDQQSQRYVKLNELNAYMPPMSGPAQQLYVEGLRHGFATYQRLTELLLPYTLEVMHDIRKTQQHPYLRLLKAVETQAKRKAIEIARYVLPIATHTSLIYTISGLVLHRLWRLCTVGEVSQESQQVITAMVEAVRKVDPHWFDQLDNQPMATEACVEASLPQSSPADFDTRWSDDLLGSYRFAKLLSSTHDAQGVLALSVRLALGRGVASLSDQDLVDLLLNPKRNPYRVERLNLLSQSPLMRALNHVGYVFIKKLSHSADSQNQRHRTVPGSRPMLSLNVTQQPDVYEPMILQYVGAARALYHDYMASTWQRIARLRNMGLTEQDVSYLLPNAVQVRFVESGSLLNLVHKWTQRTCLNAQEEIFHASMEEVQQVIKVHPFLAPYMGPPCVIRNGVCKPRCTEGAHFCGVPVWRQFPNIARRV